MIYMKIKSKKTNKSQEQQKETNSAEQDNLYNRVHSDKSTGFFLIFFFGGGGGGGVKSSNCTQQDNVDDVASSVLYTAGQC